MGLILGLNILDLIIFALRAVRTFKNSFVKLMAGGVRWTNNRVIRTQISGKN